MIKYQANQRINCFSQISNSVGEKLIYYLIPTKNSKIRNIIKRLNNNYYIEANQ